MNEWSIGCWPVLDSASAGATLARLAHYADSNGFELDAERPDAWRYRDWVVKAINADMPYDEFATLQLAGDELQPGDADALIATGFARAGPREVVGGNIDPKVRRQSELTEIAGTVGSVYLGLTLACARCHDHKFDPLPTTDYYRLQSIFAAAQYQEVPIAGDEEKKAHDALEKEINSKLKPLQEKLRALKAPYRSKLAETKGAKLSAIEREALETPADKRTPAQKKIAGGTNSVLKVDWEEVAAAVKDNSADFAERERLKRTIFEIDRTRPRPTARRHGTHRQSRRGSRNACAPSRRRQTARTESRASTAGNPTRDATGRRLRRRDSQDGENHRPSPGLRALVDAFRQSFDRRVIVNRLWHHHFGRGIVSTPGDFGARRSADPSRIARLVGDRIDRPRLASEIDS